MNTELENTRDKWRQQCEEEVERRLNGKQVYIGVGSERALVAYTWHS